MQLDYRDVRLGQKQSPERARSTPKVVTSPSTKAGFPDSDSPRPGPAMAYAYCLASTVFASHFDAAAGRPIPRFLRSFEQRRAGHAHLRLANLPVTYDGGEDLSVD